MRWFERLLGDNQQSVTNQNEIPPTLTPKQYERIEYDKGYEEGGSEDGTLSVHRNRGRATREEVEHIQSCRQLKR